MMNPHPLAHLAHRPLALLPTSLDGFVLRLAEPAARAPTPEASRFRRNAGARHAVSNRRRHCGSSAF